MFLKSPLQYCARATVLSLCVAMFFPIVQADDALVVTHVSSSIVFKSNEGGYSEIMHGVLVQAKDGTLLMMAEGRVGSRRDDAETRIVLKTSKDGGKTWSEMTTVYGVKGRTVGNATPVVDCETGKILLLFCIDNDTVWLTSSDDAGQSWASPTDMTDVLKRPEHYSFYATGPGHGIQLAQGKYRGRLIVSAYAFQRTIPGNTQGSKSFVLYSDDHGKTWQVGASTKESKPEGPDGNECMVVEMSNGDLYMTIRNNTGKPHRAYAISKDGGETWLSIQLQKDLPEPVCQASVLRLDAGDNKKAILLYLAPSRAAKGRKDKSARSDFAIWASHDNAKSWGKVYEFEKSKAGYSDLFQLIDGGFCTARNGNQENWHTDITFDRFDFSRQQ